MVATTRRPRVESIDRWHAALARAIDGGIEVRQLNSTGQWIASSGTDRTVAYEIEVVGNVVCSCSCPSAQHGDQVCRHKAMAWHLIGALDLPAPQPAPAPVSEPITETVRCQECLGDGFVRVYFSNRLRDWQPGTCHRCSGTGEVTVTVETLAA